MGDGIKKKKVLMVGPARTVKGGVSAVVNNLFEAGLDEKVRLHYLATMEDGSKLHKLWVAVRALLSYLLKVEKYDIVHIHMASDVSIYRKLPFIYIAHWWKKKVIIHQHGGNIEEFYYRQCRERNRKRIRKCLNKADVFIVIAPYLEAIFEKIVDPGKIVLMPNSVPIPQELTKNYSQAKLLFLGRLCKEKGIGELLEVCGRLREEFPDMQLYLGGTWESASLKQLADQLDPSGEWIHQPGWIGADEKDRLLRECNLFLLPSWFEGHPVSLMEGMAYSCACIASDIGGISQMVTDGENGLLVPVREEEALRETIRRCLSDSRLQERLGSRARAQIKAHYDIEKNVVRLSDLYDR